MSSIARFVVSSFLVALAAGCVSVPGDAGIADVGRTVLERASHEVAWSETVSAAENDPRVAGILESPLDADAAVAVALVNSPRVQVALAELGLARADLIEASDSRVTSSVSTAGRSGNSDTIDHGTAGSRNPIRRTSDSRRCNMSASTAARSIFACS